MASSGTSFLTLVHIMPIFLLFCLFLILVISFLDSEISLLNSTLSDSFEQIGRFVSCFSLPTANCTRKKNNINRLFIYQTFLDISDLDRFLFLSTPSSSPPVLQRSTGKNIRLSDRERQELFSALDHPLHQATSVASPPALLLSRDPRGKIFVCPIGGGKICCPSSVPVFLAPGAASRPTLPAFESQTRSVSLGSHFIKQKILILLYLT